MLGPGWAQLELENGQPRPVVGQIVRKGTDAPLIVLRARRGPLEGRIGSANGIDEQWDG